MGGYNRTEEVALLGLERVLKELGDILTHSGDCDPKRRLAGLPLENGFAGSPYFDILTVFQ